jgi:hypothetical protein
MKRSMIVLLILGLVVLGTSAAKATTLIGGSTSNGYLDENHAEFDPAANANIAYPNVWTNNGFKTNTGAYNDDLSSEPWSGPAPTPVTAGATPFDQCQGPDCGVFFKAFTGNINTGDLANAILFQDKPAVAGRQYIMGGWAGAEANYSGLIPATVTQSLFRLTFLNASSSVVGTATLDLAADGLGTPGGGPAFNYKYHQLAATAPAGTVTVRTSVEMRNGYSNPAGGGQAFVADDLALNELLPEPGSIVLCLLGTFGMIGFVRRR